MAAPPLTLRRLAAGLQRLDGSAERDHRLRWVLSWVNALEATEPSARPALWNEEPGDSGDVRWDPLLAGLAEHFAAQQDLPSLRWALAERRFLLRWWFLPDTPGARAESLVEAPIALKRRGVFLSERDLVSV